MQLEQRVRLFRGAGNGVFIMNVAINVDCMELMQQYPDKYFDLAVVDPPYGDGGGDICQRYTVRWAFRTIH